QSQGTLVELFSFLLVRFPVLLPRHLREQLEFFLFGSALLAFFYRVLLGAVGKFFVSKLRRTWAKRAVGFGQEKNVFRRLRVKINQSLSEVYRGAKPCSIDCQLYVVTHGRFGARKIRILLAVQL